ncbi:MAG: helix-turn-helix domain-containing protein [Sporichthyaceae bacterium]
MTQPSATGLAVPAAGDRDAELRALRDVARAILSVHELDQVLLTINTHLLHLLEADMAGVWLREGEEFVMGSVTGNRMVELPRVRIQPGQGVAGRVWETGGPIKVDDYVAAQQISTHFVGLAEAEAVRSALAVPLLDGTVVVGALEVWRRRTSHFTAWDVERMEAFASLAVVAIANARLHESRQHSLDELAAARRSLQTQVDFLQRSIALQSRLSDLVLQHAGPASLAQAAAEETGAVAVIVPVGGGEEVVRPAERTVPGLAGLLRSVAARSETDSVPMQERRGDRTSTWTQRVHNERGVPGAVVLLGDPTGAESGAFLEMACGQVATALRLHHLEEEAATAARDEMLDDVVWDLLTGDSPRRRAAATRLSRLHVVLEPNCRVLHGALRRTPTSTEDSERLRTRIGGALRLAGRRFGVELVIARGDWVVLIGPTAVAACRDLAAAVDETLRRDLDDVVVDWGISGGATTVHELHRAYGEARAAGSVGRRLPSAGVTAYDDMGVVRFLLPDSPAGDMQRFVDSLLGPLVEYDGRRSGRGELLSTLEAYFQSDCSARDAAERLCIHPKTLGYRLRQIHDLTGLDLTRHEDRVRADIALRIHQMSAD